MNINEKILLLRKKKETIFFDDREKNVKVANEIDKILEKSIKTFSHIVLGLVKLKNVLK